MSRSRVCSLETLASLSLGVFAVLGCAAAPPAPAATATTASGPATLQELLPLEDRSVSSFRTRTDLGDEGLLTLEFYRPRPELAEIEIAGRIQRLRVLPDGVEHATGGFLLRTPLTVGATFPGAFGQVRIVAVDSEVSVPLGRLRRCLVTIEEAQSPPRRVETTFCAGVGVAKMVVEAPSDAELMRLETELLSHGPRVDLSETP